MKIATMTALAFLSLPVCRAADDIKPLDIKTGLWETTTKTEMAGMPAMPAMPQIPEETLAKMPPAQRAQIEARMKAAGGAGGPRSTTVRSCITKETLANGRNFGQDDKSCTYKVVSSSATKQEIHAECTRSQMKMAGDLTIERIDSEHVKGSMAMKAGEGGPPMNVKVSFDNKFISADCGDVKPAAAK